MAALMLFAIESHSSSQRAWPNQALERNRHPALVHISEIKAVLVKARLALGGGRLAWSR